MNEGKPPERAKGNFNVDGKENIMPRPDISDHLIHFTKGETLHDAFENLLQIISEECLRGSSNFIRGGYNCVCFSEAPLETLSNGLVNSDYYSNYSPFGIMVKKTWLFERGGRPVIYQPEDELEELSEGHRWRHVRYDLLGEDTVDFTWEREWRIKCEELPIDPKIASIVVPDGHWAEEIIQDNLRCQMTNLMNSGFGEEEAHMYLVEFPWVIIMPR